MINTQLVGRANQTHTPSRLQQQRVFPFSLENNGRVLQIHFVKAWRNNGKQPICVGTLSRRSRLISQALFTSSAYSPFNLCPHSEANHRKRMPLLQPFIRLVKLLNPVRTHQRLFARGKLCCLLFLSATGGRRLILELLNKQLLYPPSQNYLVYSYYSNCLYEYCTKYLEVMKVC